MTNADLQRMLQEILDGNDACIKEEEDFCCYCTSCLISDRNILKNSLNHAEEVIERQEKIISDLISDKMNSDAELTPYMKDIKRRYNEELEEKERIFNHRLSIYTKQIVEETNKNTELQAENRLLEKRCKVKQFSLSYMHILDGVIIHPDFPPHKINKDGSVSEIKL